MEHAIIEVEVKSVYGNKLIYPKTHHQQLQQLTGKKTLSSQHIKALEQMGFVIKTITPTIE